MKSIQLTGPRKLEPAAMAMPPDPGPGEALVRVRAVGICGSDMHWYLEGRIGASLAVYPQVLGHEPAGEIVAVGAGVSEVAPGMRVSIEPSVGCGCCEFCRSGHMNHCMTGKFMGGPQLPGLLLEYALVPAQNVVRIPDSMSFAQATIAEPLAVILHVLELTEIRVGDTVAVLGAGPVGLLSATVARISGASRVFVADKLPHRLRIAREMGVAEACVHTGCEPLREAVLDQTHGRGVDVVVDAAGAVETINTGIAIARMGGRIVLIGIPTESVLHIDLPAAMAKELSIQTVRRSNHSTHAAVGLLATGAISDRLITHKLPLERTPGAFETLAAYADGAGKVVIEL